MPPRAPLAAIALAIAVAMAALSLTAAPLLLPIAVTPHTTKPIAAAVPPGLRPRLAAVRMPDVRTLRGSGHRPQVLQRLPLHQHVLHIVAALTGGLLIAWASRTAAAHPRPPSPALRLALMAASGEKGAPLPFFPDDQVRVLAHKLEDVQRAQAAAASDLATIKELYLRQTRKLEAAARGREAAERRLADLTLTCGAQEEFIGRLHLEREQRLAELEGLRLKLQALEGAVALQPLPLPTTETAPVAEQEGLPAVDEAEGLRVRVDEQEAKLQAAQATILALQAKKEALAAEYAKQGEELAAAQGSTTSAAAADATAALTARVEEQTRKTAEALRNKLALAQELIALRGDFLRVRTAWKAAEVKRKAADEAARRLLKQSHADELRAATDKIADLEMEVAALEREALRRPPNRTQTDGPIAAKVSRQR